MQVNKIYEMVKNEFINKIQNSYLLDKKSKNESLDKVFLAIYIFIYIYIFTYICGLVR